MKGTCYKVIQKFNIEFNMVPVSAYMNITGACSIPILQTHGQVTVVLNSKEFEFTTKMSILSGLLNAEMTVKWDWKMTYFKARIAPTRIWNFAEICSFEGVDKDACEGDALFEFKRKGADWTLQGTAGIEFPLLLTQGRAQISVFNKALSATLEAKFFGAIQSTMEISFDPRGAFSLYLSKSASA